MNTIISRKEAKVLGLKTYFTGKPCKRGHVVPRYVSGLCCSMCLADRGRKWAAENAGRMKELQQAWHHKHRDEHKARLRKDREDNPALFMWYSAKSRAREKNLPFNIEISDVVIPPNCPIFGTPLVIGTGSGPGSNPNSPSLDRVIPSLGYVKGNIVVMSMRANAIKQNATAEEILAVGEFVKNFLARKAA